MGEQGSNITQGLGLLVLKEQGHNTILLWSCILLSYGHVTQECWLSIGKPNPLYLNNGTANNLDFLAFKSTIWVLSKCPIK